MPGFLTQLLDADYMDSECRVIFAPSILHAAAELQEPEYYSVARMPAYDKYESTGFGIRAMVAEEWDVPCSYCEQNVNDEYDSDGELRDESDVTVFSRRNAFCSQACYDRQQVQWAGNRERKALTAAAAQDAK
jgi:hypothetical protein